MAQIIDITPNIEYLRLKPKNTYDEKITSTCIRADFSNGL